MLENVIINITNTMLACFLSCLASKHSVQWTHRQLLDTRLPPTAVLNSFCFFLNIFSHLSVLVSVLQLQTMRTRCEKKKQKDATRRQEELTMEQLAEKQANADACAQVSNCCMIHFVTVIITAISLSR